MQLSATHGLAAPPSARRGSMRSIGGMTHCAERGFRSPRRHVASTQIPPSARRGSMRSIGGMASLSGRGFRSPVRQKPAPSSRRRPGSIVAVSSGTASLVFSARLGGERVPFSCVAKRKAPKRRPPREHALRPSMGCGYAHGRRGSPMGHPWPYGELAHFLCATLRALPSPARRVRGAPLGAHPARSRHGEERLISLRTRPWMADGEAETDMPGAMVLATFAETKVARSRSERNCCGVREAGGKRQGCRKQRRGVPACAGMTPASTCVGERA
jgi:hypothetical protein